MKLHRHVVRRRAARFLAEGPNLVEAASRRGLVIELFVTEAAAERHPWLFTDAAVPVHLVTDRAAKVLSDTVTPAGLVAVCEQPQTGVEQVLAAAPRLVAVAVDISDPGNAGTIIRVADAMGADAVVLAGSSVDPYNGKCMRASAGSIFGLPVVQAPDLPGLIGALGAAGVRVLATTVDGELPLDTADLSVPTAWLFGSEAHGLSTEVSALADSRVRIPLHGSVESLNVAAAAAICLYQSALARSDRSDRWNR